MRMSIHDVVSVEVQAVEDLPTCKVRTITIRDVKGNRYEVTLFADDADALQIKA
jgi:hypothetical protein